MWPLFVIAIAVFWVASTNDTESETLPTETDTMGLGRSHPSLTAWYLVAQRELPFALRISSSTRSYAQQEEIYSWGRTKQNPFVAATPDLPFGPTATNARGGETPHNVYSDGFSHAIDVQPGSMTVDEYETMGRHAEAHGLYWGGHFKLSGTPDYAHVETKIWRGLSPDKES